MPKSHITKNTLEIPGWRDVVTKIDSHESARSILSHTLGARVITANLIAIVLLLTASRLFVAAEIVLDRARVFCVGALWCRHSDCSNRYHRVLGLNRPYEHFIVMNLRLRFFDAVVDLLYQKMVLANAV